MQSVSLPEAWLRGSPAGVSPFVAPLLFSFQQAREDLAAAAGGLTAEHIWSSPGGLTPMGYHLRHLAGSVDRLTGYLEGRQLSPEQLAALKAEGEPGASGEELLEGVEQSFARAEQVVSALDANSLTEPRAVGRKQLPTTVIGLLVHIAEHTQRHVGQAVITARLLRNQLR